MALPEDVVLYDLDADASIDELIALTSDPESAWFARARLASLAQRGLVAATWNPNLHPRGRDGKFIHTFGWVRWIYQGTFHRGQVNNIDPKTGVVSVAITVPGKGGKPIKDGEIVQFTPEQVAKRLYGVPSPKASLDLPDPKNTTDSAGGYSSFDKIGGQGGSNPGGLYQAQESFGPEGSLTQSQMQGVVDRHELEDTGGSGTLPGVAQIAYNPSDGRVVLLTGLGGDFLNTNGTAVTEPLNDAEWYGGDSDSVMAAWGEAVALADLLSNGDKVYVKHAKSEQHAANEVLANRFYELAGVNVAETILGKDNITIGSKLVKESVGKVNIGDVLDNPEILTRMRRDFVVDAWLANWDVAGLGLENTQVVDGYPYRIDAGGALLYRAQGGPKGANFGPVVGELETLRDPQMNAAAAKIFKGVTDDEIKDGAERIAAITPDMIIAQAYVSGLPITLADQVADTLIARRKYILDKYGIDDPAIVMPSPPTAQYTAIDNSSVDSPEMGTEGLVWFTKDQVWKPGEITPKIANESIAYNLDLLSKSYDDPKNFQDTNFKDLALLAPDEDAYVVLDGQLWKVLYTAPDPGTLDVESVSTGEQKQYVLGDATVRAHVGWKDTFQGNVKQISALETLIRSLTVTQMLTGSEPFEVTLESAIFSYNNVDPEGPELGVATPPQFNVEPNAIFVNDDGLTYSLGGGTEKAKMLWSPEQHRLFQILPEGDTGSITLMDPLTGHLLTSEEMGKLFTDGEDVWLINEDDTFSMEVAEAFIQKEQPQADSLDEALPNKVDQQLIEALDKKAQAVDAITVDQGDTVPSALSAPEPGDPLLDIWQSKLPVVPSDSTHVDGVHDSLNTGPAISFTDLTSADRKTTAESMVGKMVLITMDKEEYIPVSGMTTLPKLHGDKPVFTTAYVESVEDSPTGAVKLWFRLPNGQKKYIMIDNPSTGKTSNSTWRVIENLSPEIFKSASAPTIKANGQITYNGKVVGFWTPNNESYWNKTIDYVVYPEFTVTGYAIGGQVTSKTGLRSFVHYLLVPEAPPVKAKKGSPASKKIADVAAKAEVPELQGQTYSDGTSAKMGDWVQSTKGGGGFVGKIVGWPNQESNPGLVFVVSPDGVQKAVKLKTQKKVNAPSDAVLQDIAGEVPNAYLGHKLADGSTPQVGQKVEAGKTGSKITGFVTHINPSQGWVYIQTPDGKNVSKTMNVTTVLEQPLLYWDANPAATAAVLETTPKPKKPKKVEGYNYPGPDGALYQQKLGALDAWLNGGPKRKATKDGYAPEVGMRARNKDGDELVIMAVAGEWDALPNRTWAWNITKSKQQILASSSLEVDHAAMITGFDGDPVKHVAALHLTSGDTIYPDGSVIYRYSTTMTYNTKPGGKYRVFNDYGYFIVSPDGQSWRVYSDSQGNAFVNSPQTLQSLKWQFQSSLPEKVERVAVIDSDAPGSVSLKLAVKAGDYSTTGVHYEPSTVDFDQTASIPEPEVEITPEQAPSVEAPADVPDAAAEIAEPTPEPVGPAKTIPSINLSIIPAPPNPQPKAAAIQADPELPVVAGSSDLAGKNKTVGKQALSMAEGAKAMLAKKDTKDPGSALQYAMGDSDFIEDMAIRYTVEKRADGTEHLVMRFRLREDQAEDTVAKMVAVSGTGKKGAWKVQGIKFAKSLEDGDLIAVYPSSMDGNPLKPASPEQHPMDEPNARVVGKPKLVGKSPKNPEVDLWRVTVVTQDGTVGDVDMEQRSQGSIQTFEYDHNAPAKVTGNTLKITNTASAAGWVKTGQMTVKGSQSSVLLDEQGKVVWNGATTGDMAKGTGGQHLDRVLPTGTTISFNAAHSTEGGTGFDTTRRANIAGEVQISTPISGGKYDGRPEADIIKSLSEAMQAVGVPVEKQQPPTDQQMLTFALTKMVTNYHPKYDYRGKPVTSLEDPRVNETFAAMSSKLQTHLGRNVGPEDVRIHFFENGRMSVVWSPEVAKAIGKAQGVKHYGHHGVHNPAFVLGGTANGLMSTDERWSMGVLTTGMSSHEDMRIGSGDRVYMKDSTGFNANYVILSPLAVNSNMDVYTKGVGDNYGRRDSKNRMLDHPSSWEFMLKRKIEPEQITFYIASSEQAKKQIVDDLAAKGVTQIGGRPISSIVVTADQAKKMNLDDIGIEHFANDIPITTLLGAAS